jgi:hypothetical protein
MSEIKYADRAAFADALQGPWDIEDKRFDGIRKAMKDVFDRAAEDFQCWVEAGLADNIAYTSMHTVERIIEAIMEGNEAEFRRWVKADTYTGRDQDSPREPVIHGKLFEHGPILLRRKMCDAHPDLLKNERILDLENQLAGAVAQIAKLQRELERARYD